MMDIGVYIYDEMHELYVLETQIEMSVYAPCRFFMPESFLATA